MVYLLAYLAPGLFLAFASLRRRKSTLREQILSVLVLALAWPVLVLIAPEAFVGSARDGKDELESSEERLFRELRSLTAQRLEGLSQAERVCVARVGQGGVGGTTFFADSADFEEILRYYWESDVPPAAYRTLRAARWRLTPDYEPSESDVRFSLAPPDWFVGFSDEFLRCIAKVDKTKRARVLEAIGKISQQPTTPHGDTVKPLTGDLAGFWRYRVGDDRLIYKPDAGSKQIVLISFGSRGDIYE
jgi:mRNA interferase RelE/StbE